MPVLGNKHFVYTLWWIDYWEWYLVHQHKYGGLMPTIGWNMGLHGLEFYFILFYFILFYLCFALFIFSVFSVQFSHSVVSDSFQPHEPQHARPPWLNSRSSPKLMSIELVIPSNHLIVCHPLLLLPSIFPSIRVFSNESALLIRWPKYWSFSFNISPSNDIQDWFPLGWTGWISLQSKRLSRVFANTTVKSINSRCSAFFIV